MENCINKECEYWSSLVDGQCGTISKNSFHKCRDYITEKKPVRHPELMKRLNEFNKGDNEYSLFFLLKDIIQHLPEKK